jgi:hypothetical protein
VGRARDGYYGYGYGYGYGPEDEDGGVRAPAPTGGLFSRAREALRGRRSPTPQREQVPDWANEQRDVGFPARQDSPAETMPVGHTGERSLTLRTVDRAKLLRALELFEASDYAREIADIARSVASPKASVRASEASFSEVLLTVAWERSWYQYVIDLSDTEDAVRLWESGAVADELPAEFRQWNASVRPDGSLELIREAARRSTARGPRAPRFDRLAGPEAETEARQEGQLGE